MASEGRMNDLSYDLKRISRKSNSPGGQPSDDESAGLPVRSAADRIGGGEKGRTP
jgi:hypothetical protein